MDSHHTVSPRPDLAVMPEGLACPDDGGAGLPPASPTDFTHLFREVERTAREWDVRADLPEGRFVSSMLATVAGVGQMLQDTKLELARQFEINRTAAADELSRAKEITKAANVALSQARQAGLTYVVEQENVVVRMIDKTLPLFIEKMQGTLVLREKRLNAAAQRRLYALAVLTTLVLVGSGYAVRAWQDMDATGALAQCLARPYQAGGKLFCDVTRFGHPAP